MIKTVEGTGMVKIGFSPSIKAIDNPFRIMEYWANSESVIRRLIIYFCNGDDLSFAVKDVMAGYKDILAGNTELSEVGLTRMDQLPTRTSVLTCARPLVAAQMIIPDEYARGKFHIVRASRRFQK